MTELGCVHASKALIHQHNLIAMEMEDGETYLGNSFQGNVSVADVAVVTKQVDTESRPKTVLDSTPLKFSLLLIISGFFLLISTHSFDQRIPGKGTETKLNAFDPEAEARTVTNENFPLSDFGIRRVGYDKLPYFGGDKEEISNYKIFEKYDHIIEPYATSIAYYEGKEDMDYFKYYVYQAGEESFESTGKVYLDDDDDKSESFTTECKAFDTYYVKIRVRRDESWVYVGTMSTMCMYVRREIRELSDDHLDAAISAMNVLWETEEDEGQKKYGDDFHNIQWFAQLHHFNAAWKDADHFHEGLGFLPQHIKLSNMFELAIQAVDPSVSLFYWDFTYENQKGLSLTKSPMFQSSTFGELATPTDDYWGWTYRNDSIEDAVIQSGAWRKTKAGVNPYADLDNGFGYMRGPWNMNPSEYLLRFSRETSELPGCTTYFNWLSENDFGSYMQQSGYAPHASTHGSLGGVFGCDMMDELREADLIDDTAQLAVCSKWGFYIKELYRADFLTPKQDCSVDSGLTSAGMSCGFTCDDDEADELIYFVKDSLSLKNYVTEDIDDDGWEQWRQFICNGNGYKIFVGDHLESASPMDPSFWPIHPTQDRLLQLKYMSGGFDDFSWPTEATRTGAYVCNHAKCYDYSIYGSEKDYYDFCCEGHFEESQIYDFVKGDRSQGYGPTNREILDAIDPTSKSYSVPYIYGSFKWDHCTQNFDALIESLYDARRR